MIVLGIDPGLATIGVGIIGTEKNVYKAIDFGVITTPPNHDISRRLKTIYQELGKVIDDYRPERIGIEKLYFNSNKKTALDVAHARGVIMLACAERVAKVGEYTPLQVKQSITGYGGAEKMQMQRMVMALLNLNALPRPDDAADALAIAITEARTPR